MSLRIEITIQILGEDKPVGSSALAYPFLQLAQSQGVSRQKLFKDMGFPEDMLYVHNQMEFATFKAMLCAIERQKSIEELGLLLGSHFSLQNFGVLAQTALTAPTLRDAIYHFKKYLPIFVQIAHISIKPYSGPLTIVCRSQFYEDSIVHRFFACSNLSVLNSMFRQVTDQTFDVVAELSCPEPENTSPYLDQFGPDVSFDCFENQIVFKGLDVDAPLPGCNPVLHRQGLKFCEQEFAGLKTESTRNRQDLILTVRELIIESLGKPVSIHFLANRLGMSERSLRRHLSKNGLSFREIYNSVKTSFAKNKLADQSVPIAVIAHELGYDSSANFSRAFKNWVGQSPQQFRSTYRVPDNSDSHSVIE